MVAVLGFFAGIGLGVFLVGRTRTRSPLEQRRIYALWLAIAALVYVGFGLLGNANVRWLAYETIGVVLFAGLGWAGVRRPVVLAAAWASHVLWDVILHLGESPGASYTPQWYAWL